MRGHAAALAALAVVLHGCPVLPPPGSTCEVDGTGCGPFFLGPAVPLYANCFEVESATGPVPVCFTCPCNVHDLCYSTCGTIKEECDRTFLDSMLEACDNALGADPGLDACSNRAHVYALLVILGGDVSFDEGQRIGCVDTKSSGTKGFFLDGPPFWPRPFQTPFPDEDLDLIPDTWEDAHGLDSRNTSDCFEDYDGDGFINIVEYLHGFDPFEPNEVAFKSWQAG